MKIISDLYRVKKRTPIVDDWKNHNWCYEFNIINVSGAMCVTA